MATTKEIKRRISSIKNTKKITKAMELVAASKMKRAVGSALASRTYSSYAWSILQSLSNIKEESTHPLLEEREVKTILVVLLTSNKGLCGAFNSQVIKKIINLIKEQDLAVGPLNRKLKFISVGKKGDAMLRRMKRDIHSSFSNLPDYLSLHDTAPISSIITKEYQNKNCDKVLIAYTNYISAIKQEPELRQLLPLSKADLKFIVNTTGKDSSKSVDITSSSNYLFEPGYQKLMPEMIEKLVRMQIYQTLLESMASEQSARMVAMKNASDASREMIDELTLVFNKARQAGITQEIAEVSTGMATVE